LWTTHVNGWLSDAELEEVNRLFRRLVEVISHASVDQSTGRKAFELTLALSPATQKAPARGP
jgi:hypothetical protein